MLGVGVSVPALAARGIAPPFLRYPGASLILDPEAGLYARANPMQTYSSLADLLAALGATVQRNTARWVFNSAGVLTQVPANQIALDYDPVTLALRGLPFEPARTNLIPNSACAGAVPGVIGSGGVLPTGWTQSLTAVGVTVTVIGTGQDAQGRPYLEVELNGSTGAQSGRIRAGANNGLALVASAQYAMSSRVELVSGSLTPISGGASTTHGLVLYNGAAFDSGLLTAYVIGTAQDISHVATTSATATGGHYEWFFNLQTFNNARLRLGIPQVERATNAASKTSPIITTGSALTRDADIINLPTAAPWFNAAEFSLFMQLTPYALTPASDHLTIWDGAVGSNGVIRLNSAGASGETQQLNSTDATGSNQGTLGHGGPYSAGVRRKVAVRIKQDDAAFTVNGNGGTGVFKDNTYNVNQAFGQLRIGPRLNAPAMHLEKLIIYPYGRSDAELGASVS